MKDPQSSFSGLNRFDQVDATGAIDEFLNFLVQIETTPDVVPHLHRSCDRPALRARMVTALGYFRNWHIADGPVRMRSDRY